MEIELEAVGIKINTNLFTTEDTEKRELNSFYTHTKPLRTQSFLFNIPVYNS